jgi:hypothetical protein
MSEPQNVLLTDRINADDSSHRRKTARHHRPGMSLGRLTAFDADAWPLITLNDGTASTPLRALSCVKLQPDDIGRDVCVVFAADRQAVVMGILNRNEESARSVPAQEIAYELEIDGQVVTLRAREKLVIKCGKASVTLTKAGKVLINGEYVVSRARGINAIKGGAIELN